MFHMLINYSIEAAPLAIIVYAITWRLMRTRSGQKLHLPKAWHVVAGTITALGVGATRLFVAYFFGGEAMRELWTNRGPGLIGPVGIPVALAVCLILVLRTRGLVRPRSVNATNEMNLRGKGTKSDEGI